MNRTNGRIAEDSRKKICTALIKLMKIYDYREITVTQLSQEAELSRKTYYRLFCDKDEVLLELFFGLYSECAKELNARDVGQYWDLMQTYFDFWEKRRELLVILEKNGLLPRLFDYVYKEAYRNAGNIFPAVVKAGESKNNTEILPYLLSYSIGGMNGLLIKWVESGMSIPSDLLIDGVRAGINPHEQ